MKRIKKTLTLVSMAVLLLTACEAPKELGVVPYPQYAQTTSKNSRTAIYGNLLDQSGEIRHE